MPKTDLDLQGLSYRLSSDFSERLELNPIIATTLYYSEPGVCCGRSRQMSDQVDEDHILGLFDMYGVHLPAEAYWCTLYFWFNQGLSDT